MDMIIMKKKWRMSLSMSMRGAMVQRFAEAQLLELRLVLACLQASFKFSFVALMVAPWYSMVFSISTLLGIWVA